MLNWLKNNKVKTALIIILLTVEYLNFTGFCYSDGRYYSKEELLRIGVGKIYEEDPNCCSVYDIKDRDMNYFLNNFFARHFYGLVIITKRDMTQYDDPKETYVRAWSYLSSCGAVHRDYSENLTEERYKSYIEKKSEKIK